MNTTSDGGNQHGRGLRGDPGADRGQEDGTRDQMCNRISELEAARDHLRARLHQLAAKWQAMDLVKSGQFSQRRLTLTERNWLNACAADLLAVLTEPQQNKNNEKTNENAVTRSAETDVIREVAKEMRFLVSSPDVDEDVIPLKQSLRRRLLAWAERLSPSGQM